MSYRVDIPTLSANEVYTLTFEYEGTETIQLIVGDLTLETTDRRVVFTTTSPVNYIESNTNLTNLNIYEGYYESDDFGGEYTQESYIEGKSLVNYHDFNKCIYSINNETQGKWEFLDDGFARMTTLNVNYNHCRPKPTNYTSEATYTVATWVRNFNSEAGNVKFECFHYLDAIKTIKLDGSTDTTSGDRGTHYYSTGQEGLMISVGKYVGISSKIINGTHHQYMGNFGTSGGFVSGDSVEIFVMVLEGDKADDILNGLIQPFHGIGCVKSPTIKSLSPENLYVSPLKYREPLRGYEYYHNDGTVEIYPNGGGAYSTIDLYTGEDVGYSYSGNQRTWYVNNGIKLGLGVGTYYFCCEIELVANKQITDFTGRPQVDVVYDNAQYFSVSGDFTETYDGEKYYYKGIYGASYKTVTDDIRGIYVGIWSYGISGVEKYVIRNITLTKEASLKDICAISKSSIITTPDDLELYDVHYGNGDIAKQDKLDLTTGIVTRNVCKWKLNDYLSSNLNYWNFREWDKKDEGTNEYVRIQVGALGCPNGKPTLARGWSEVYGLYFDYWDTDYGASYLYDGKTYFYGTSSGVFFMCSKAQILSWTGVESYELLTKQHIYDWFIAGDFTMMNALSEPTTEQVSINPLKSYRNGSIQTSSQQLAPTLKTTLPVSNKFTQTNLTSGSTCNVYFDGTATKLDAGGTIITNPVSPCEVECGGTTLTIEGTDIQNVRVLETTVKNEVGSNGTSDVELSRIKTANSPSDSLISTKIEYWEQTTEYGNALRYVLPIQVKPNTKYILNTTNIQRLFAIWDVNRNQLVLQNIYANSPYIWTTPADCPSEVYLYLVYQTDVNRAHLDELRMFEGEIDFGYQGQQEPLISQTISTLEQPVKLRSLGTTYDSYNPVTGELTKRIGVSETDGSYSVLSSPIVISSNYKILQDNNIILDSFPQEMNGAYIDFLPTQLLPNTTYTVFLDATTAVGQLECGLIYNGDWYDGIKTFTVGVQSFVYTTNNQIDKFGGFRIRGWGSIINNLIMVQGEYSLDYYNPIIPPHLYTNGQVKVYSDSEVYPTTILNGQSTNNYEINELNKSNNYTIRYEGECESINLNGKSNEQGTNRIVKSGTDGSGNLTFVNDSGDIDNVLLVQNDVREQEINHFNGLQTVEINQIFVSNKQNLFEQYMKNDFDHENVTPWYTGYSSLHRGVFNCGVSVAGNNVQLSFDLIHPKIGGSISEETPIMKAEKIYNISCNITVNDDTSQRKYEITFYDKSGSQIYAQRVDNILPVLSLNTTADNTNTTAKINANTFFNEDVYDVRLYASKGGQWVFDCTITDFIICEPEYAKPDVPLVYEYIDLPQPVQLNSLLDGTHDTYNPITGEYIQNVGYLKASDATIGYRSNTTTHIFTIGNDTITNPPILTSGWATYLESSVLPRVYNETVFGITQSNLYWYLGMNIPKTMYPIKEDALQWILNNVIILYKAKEPIVTQLTPINIPTFEGGILQLITTDGKVFPMVEYSMPTNNRYDTSSWEVGAVYTQRNMTEVYFNESATPMTPTETMTLTTDHISSGSIILNDNGNGLIVLKGNYTGRDIPYFTGMRSVEAIEVETTPSPDQPLFGKGGRK